MKFLIQGIDRNVFRELLHSTFDIATEETLMERIFVSWEKGNEGQPLRLEGWVVGLSVFLRGTLSEKAAFCFRVYDLNNDGFVTKDEMFTLLKSCLIKQPQDEDPDESVKDLVEIALRKFDVDKDGKVIRVQASGVLEEISCVGRCRSHIKIICLRSSTSLYFLKPWVSVCPRKVLSFHFYPLFRVNILEWTKRTI